MSDGCAAVLPILPCNKRGEGLDGETDDILGQKLLFLPRMQNGAKWGTGARRRRVLVRSLQRDHGAYNNQTQDLYLQGLRKRNTVLGQSK